MPEVAQATITVTPVMAGAQEKITNDLTSAAGSAGTAAGTQAGTTMSKAISDKMGSAGKAMTAGVTAPLTAGATAAVAAWKEVDTGLDTIVTKTGASGDALEEMHDILNNITTTIPTGFETAGAAIGEVNTRFGVTGDELEDLSTKFIKFADINGQDVSSSVDSVSKMMAAFGLETEDAGRILDALNVVGQQTGVDVGQLSDLVAANAAQFQEMGLSAEDAAAFLGSCSMAGLDSSTAMMGLKTAMKNATEEGVTLDEKLAEFSETMQGNGTQSEKLAAAYELFGTRGGAAIANAVENGELDLADFTTTLGDFEGSVDDTFAGTKGPMDDFQTTLNELKVLGADIVESVGPTLADILERVGSAVETVTEAWNGLSPQMQDFILKAAGIAAIIGPLLMIGSKVVGSIGTIAGGIGNIASKIGSMGASAAAAAAPTAAVGASFGTMAGQALMLVAAAAAIYITAQAISVLVDAAIRITEAGGPAIAVLVGMGAGIVGLMAAAAALGPALTAGAIGIGVFGAAMLGIGAGIDLACQGIAKVTDAISNLVSTIADNAPQINSIVTNIGTTVSGVIDTISNGIIGVIDAISGGISGVLDSLSGVIDSIGQAALNAGTGFEKLANAIIKLTNNTGIFDLAGTLASVAVGVGKITNAASGASSAASSINSMTTALQKLATNATNTGTAVTKFGAMTRTAMTQVGTALRTAGTATTQFASASQSSMSRTNSALNSTKSAMSSFASSVRSTMQSVRSAFSNLDLASGLRSALSSALSVARSGLSSLKSAFSNTHFSFQQHIKVPHFSMSGKFNAETGAVPTVRTSWYKVAQSTPYLFKNPTLFGAGEGSQDEMLYGRDALMRDIAEASGSAEQAAQLDAIRRIMDGMYTLMQEGQTITIGKRDFARLMYEVS